MVCVYCKQKTYVVNSRHFKKINITWRRRTCKNCQAIFSTKEWVDLGSSLRVSSSSGELTEFLRDKLFISVYLSLLHRKTALTDAMGLADTIIGKILTNTNKGLVNTTEIRQITSEVLGRFDKVSSTYYLAHNQVS